MNTRIHCITLPVENLHESLAFYRDGLRLSGTDHVALEADSDHYPLQFQDGLYLVMTLRSGFKEFTDDAQQEVATPGVSECVLSYFAPDNATVDTLLKSAAAAGGRVAAPAREQPWGYSGYVVDPDGHMWEIMCNPALNMPPVPSNDSYGIVTAPGTVRIERLLPGPLERVWSYLIDSSKRGKWLASGSMEQKLGGAVTLHFAHATLSSADDPIPEKYKEMENGHEGHARITQFEPPHRLGMTWMEEEGDPSEVVFELTARGDDVHLVLTHQRLGSRDAMLSVSSGWHAHLDILMDHLNGLPTRPFWATHARLETEYDERLPRE